MHRYGLTLAALLFLSFQAPAFAAEEYKPSPRMMTLPVELKDPFTAYALGLVPFNSMSAANYVGTSRLAGSVDGRVAWSGITQFAADAGMVALGYALISQPPASSLGPFGVVVLGCIPLAHIAFYAPFWSQSAAGFNRDALRKAGFGYEVDNPPDPGALR